MNPQGRIAVDIGGTFTDIIFCPDGKPPIARKVLSTPDNYARSVIEALSLLLAEFGLDPAAVRTFVHATTVATNAVLERKGARAGLVTTAGFRDVFEIGRLRLPVLYDLTWQKPAALVTRHHCVEVAERVDHEGRVLTQLDTDQVHAQLRALVADGVESVAVAFLHSYVNPDHEEQVGRIIEAEFPGLHYSLSARLVREMREFERTSTTVVDAYVKPVVHGYLSSLQQGIARMGLSAPIFLMQSSGGLMDVQAAKKAPVHILESGPAAGVVGVNHAARKASIPNVLSFDMGGTTAKAALIEHGEFHRSAEFEVGGAISATSRILRGGGYLIRLPVIDVAEVGAGGGSIAWLDQGGALHIGPQSAGAVPGPVCYGLGGEEPTVTDANVVLGYLDAEAIGRGILLPDSDGAARAIERRIARPTGMSVLRAAHAIHTVANATMMRALRAVSTERGRDLRDFTLFGFGGSGPVHAANLAAALQMSSVVIPRFPGLFSAFGLLCSQVEQRRVQTYLRRLSELEPADLSLQFQRLAADAVSALVQQGYAAARIRVVTSADLKYTGQQYELEVGVQEAAADAAMTRPDPQRLATLFHAEHQRTYGYTSKQPIQIVNLRVATVVDEAFTPPAGQSQGDYRRRHDRRPVYFAEEDCSSAVPVVSRGDLAMARPGPLLVEEYDTTTVIPKGTHAHLDSEGQICIAFETGRQGALKAGRL